MADGPVFPAFLKLEYQRDNSAKSSFLAEVASISGEAKQQFQRSFEEVGAIIGRSLSGFRTGGFRIDLDTSALRQAASEAEFAAQRLAFTRDAATQLASTTGDTTRTTQTYLQALRAQTIEAERNARAAGEQATTYGRLQEQIDRTIDKNQALAASFRATFAEQAKAANFAHAYQQGINEVFASGLAGPSKSARSSASVFEEQSYAPKADTRSGLDRMLAGSASLDRAAVSATTLEQVLGRVSAKGAEVAASLQQSAEITARAAEEEASRIAAAKREEAAALAEAQATAKRYADSANELRLRLDPSLAAQQRFDAELSRADELMSAGAISAKEYAQAQALAAQNLQSAWTALTASEEENTQAKRRGTTETSNVINGVRAQRVAFIQLGQQMQDVVVQTKMGTDATTVFVQQVPQMAFALSGLEGNTNKTYDRIGQFASFMAGPWGAAIFAATAVIGPLIASTIDLGDETDKAVDKLKNDAAETETARRAKEIFKTTVEGVTAAINDQKVALDKQADSYRSEAERARDAAKQNRDHALSIRENTVALLEHARAQSAAANSQTFGAAGGAGAGMAQAVYARQVTEVEAALENAKKALETAQSNLTASQSFVDVEQGKANADPVARIKKHYDDLIDKARRRAVAEGKVGEALEKQVATLQKQSAAAVAAQRESQKSDTGVLNRANDLGNMVALIKQLFPGAAITSTNGGKHTTGSDHYKDRAIDFVPAGGMGTYSKADVEQILKDAGVNIRRNGKGVEQFFGPGDKGHSDHFHVAWQGSAPDPDKVAAAAERAQAKLDAFGSKSSEAIARVNERFNEQPRLIDQARQSMRQLDDIVAQLEERRPPGFEAMIAEADTARQSIADALVRPYQELERNSERRVQLQELLVKGRDAEANALQDVWRLEDQLGPMTAERRNQVLEIAQAEQKHVEALQRAQEAQQAYLDTTRSIRSAVEGILGGYGKLSDLKSIGQQLRGRVLTEQVFGDVFRDMDKWVKDKTNIGSSVDLMGKETARAGEAAGAFADSMVAATDRLQRIMQRDISRTSVGGSGSLWPLGAMSTPALIAAPANENPPIVVTASKPKNAEPTLAEMSPAQYFDRMGSKMTQPILNQLSGLVGPKLSSMLAGPLTGAAIGFAATGSRVGAGIGAALKIAGMSNSSVAGAMDAFGTAVEVNKMVGDIFGFEGGPLGILTGLFSKKPRGGGAVTQDSVYTHANDGAIGSAMDSFGSSLQGNISKIAQQLGAQIGSYDVGIGRYKDYYQVSAVGNDQALGNSYFQNRSGNALYDGTDAEAAMRAAILNALQDGAIKGIRDGSLRLLKAGKDLDAQLQKAMDFENVFKTLKTYTDPVGAALDTLDAEFTKLKETFKEAGASTQEFADLEKLYGIQRTQAVKQAMDQITGSLQSLLNDLTVNNDALSLRDRKADALAKYQPLAERVKAGDTTAYDDYADAARQLLEIERQMSGSQGDYFALLEQVTSLTKTRLDETKSVADAAANRDSPFSSSSSTASPANDNAGVSSAIDALGGRLLDGLGFKLDAVNQNLGALILQGQSGTQPGASPLPFMNAANW
ncbi:hypothetical protein [Novosphingobium sp.]|uniref:hypothetical protein n=1 Tax=Novosphingobium sp. TaxID=1874826 RepID=UPI002FDD3ADB